MPSFLRKLAIAMLLAGMLLVPATATAAPGYIERGFADDFAFRYLSAEGRKVSLSHARMAGAGFVRLGLNWSSVAPPGRRKPSGFRASDPADPRYIWNELDRAVREVSAAGLDPLIVASFAPSWAEGRDRPRRRTRFTRPGVWRPRTGELAAFMTALSRRYSGRFLDPATPGAALPRVRHWQVWNEPNLWPFLQPQWQRRRGQWVKTAAHDYRRMLNASYRALKRVSPTNNVIAGGLAPFGDLKPSRHGGRIAPARFLRALLCLRGRRVLRRACRARTSFDAYSFHPYSLGGPRRRALNPDDTTIPDAHKLRRAVRTALRIGTATPRGAKPLWATEMGWDTRPPNPHGLRPRTQARYLNDSLFVLWRSGVSHAANFLLRDLGGRTPRRAVDPQRRQSGVFFRRRSAMRDKPKPSFLSMRFPFVVLPRAGGRGRAWGAPPCGTGCRIAIEYRSRGRWRPLDSFTVGGGRVFRRTIRVGRRTVLRARVTGTGVVSLTTIPRKL
jgi:hypothetical protein